MGSRISDVLCTLDLVNRYCEDPFDVLSADREINYDDPRPVFEELKLDSYRFVDSMIKGLSNE